MIPSSKITQPIIDELYNKMNPVHMKFNNDIRQSRINLMWQIINEKGDEYKDLCDFVRYQVGDSTLEIYIANKNTDRFTVIPEMLVEHLGLKCSISDIVELHMSALGNTKEAIKKIKEDLLKMYKGTGSVVQASNGIDSTDYNIITTNHNGNTSATLTVGQQPW